MAESAEILAVEARLKDFISANLKNVKGNLKDFERQVKKNFDGAGRSGKKLGLVMRQLKTAFVGMLTIAAVKFAVIDTTKAFVEFEARMAEVNTIARLNKEELGGITKQLEELATRLPKSADELGAGFYQVLSANIKDTGDALFVLEEATKLAIAGVADTAPTVKLVAGVINSYGYAIEDVTKVSDILFKTVENGIITIPELSTSIGRVLPIARAAKIPLEELTAGIATLTSAGVPSEIAVTALRGAISALSAPTPAATAALEDLNIVMKDDLVETIKQFEGLDPKALKALIPDVRAATAVITLANNYKQFGKNVESAFNSGGAALKAFNTQMDTTNADLKLMANEWDQTKRNIGAAFGGLLRYANKFNKFMEKAPPLLSALSGNWVEYYDRTKDAEEATSSLLKTFDAFQKKSDQLNAAEAERIKQGQKGATGGTPEAADEGQKQVLEAEIRLRESKIALREDSNMREVLLLKSMHLAELEALGDNFSAKKILKSAQDNELTALIYAQDERETDAAREKAKNLKDINDKQLNDLKTSATQKAQQLSMIAGALGAAMTSGMWEGAEGWKIGAKNMLMVMLGYVEQQILISKTAALATALMTPGFTGLPKALLNIGLITAAFGAAKATVSSWQTATGEIKTVPGNPNEGRLAVVHGGEQIGRPINNVSNMGGNTINVYTMNPDIMERQMVEAMERALRNKRLDKFRMKYETA